jgi:hypothetical protein
VSSLEYVDRGDAPTLTQERYLNMFAATGACARVRPIHETGDARECSSTSRWGQRSTDNGGRGRNAIALVARSSRRIGFSSDGRRRHGQSARCRRMLVGRRTGMSTSVRPNLLHDHKRCPDERRRQALSRSSGHGAHLRSDRLHSRAFWAGEARARVG